MNNNVAPILAGTFQFVNPTADPKSFDLTNDTGGRAYAIFEIDGNTLQSQRPQGPANRLHLSSR